MKNNDLDPKLVLKAFGGSLGLLLGALGGLLAALWGLYIDHKWLPDSSWNFIGPRLLASGCFFLVYVRYSFFDVVFYLLSEPLGVDFEIPSRPPEYQKP